MFAFDLSLKIPSSLPKAPEFAVTSIFCIPPCRLVYYLRMRRSLPRRCTPLPVILPKSDSEPKRARPFWLPSPPLAVVKEDDAHRLGPSPVQMFSFESAFDSAINMGWKAQDEKESCCFNQEEDETVWTTADAIPRPPTPTASCFSSLFSCGSPDLHIVLQPQTACCVKTLNRLSHCCFIKTSLEIPRLHHETTSMKVLCLKEAGWTVAGAPSDTNDYSWFRKVAIISKTDKEKSWNNKCVWLVVTEQLESEVKWADQWTERRVLPHFKDMNSLLLLVLQLAAELFIHTWLQTAKRPKCWQPLYRKQNRLVSVH